MIEISLLLETQVKTQNAHIIEQVAGVQQKLMALEKRWSEEEAVTNKKKSKQEKKMEGSEPQQDG